MMIYKPEFKFTFHSVNTTFGLVGLVFYLFNHSKQSFYSYNGAHYKKILKTYYPVILVSMLSILINMSLDLHYVTYIITCILCFFMVYLGMWGIYRVYGEITPKILMDFFIIAAFIHLGVSLAKYASSSINDIVTSMLRLSEGDEIAMSRTMGSRLQGFGATYFTSGIINGFIMIMMGFTMMSEKLSSGKKAYYIVSFVIILILAMMNARTAMIGGAIGALLIIISYLKDSKHLFTNVMSIVAAISITFLIATLIPGSGIDFETLYNFGFEMVFALEGGSTSTYTTDVMVSQYSIMPDNLKTWLIGDAHWVGATSYTYYMKTDIGVFRNLFYFGVIGSFYFYMYNWKILKLSITRNNIFGKLSMHVVFVLFVYTMILNFKGATDLFYYVLPFFFCGKRMTSISFKNHFKKRDEKFVLFNDKVV